MPGPGRATFGISAAAMVAAGAGAILWTGGHHPLSAGLLVTGAALLAGVLGRHPARPRALFHAREAAMSIVPWGVLVNPDTDPRTLRWPAIRKVIVDVTHTMRGGTPDAIASVVTIDTGRERLAGRTWGAAGLEALVVNLEAYAEEAARPVALDLEGQEEAGDGATEPVMSDLLRSAGDLCSTGRGAALLGLPPGGYRSIANAAAGPETTALLREILASRVTTPADARPLAAIVAARLDARALMPDLLHLVACPHPVVAAVAKAAAKRLGAPQSRAGAVDEVGAFLFEEDLSQIERWAGEQ